MGQQKKNNKSIAILVLVIAILLIGGGLYFFVSQPKAQQSTVEQTTALPFSDEIQVTTPAQNEKVISPIKITGQAKGMWYFEGTFNAELFDSNNTSLGNTQVNAKGDWMSESFVAFEGDLTFSSPATKKGTLVISKDNPSGLAENEKKLTIPVSF